MAAEKANFPINFMCRMLEVSRSGFYAWCKRRVSQRARRDRVLVVQVHDVFAQSSRRYGSPRVRHELKARGLVVGRHHVARLMRQEKLQARPRRRFVRTTNSEHGERIAPNLVARRFTAEKPNQLWASDITYVPTTEGWLYLAVVIDLCSRRVVGWSMSVLLDAQLALDALDMALGARSVEPGLVHHSDRGVQYASEAYRSALRENHIEASMSRKGDCWDNACVESFFSTLKTELLYRRRPLSIERTRAEIFEYVEAFYNRVRLHSANGYVCPVVYEKDAA
jgi:transposase InsO family protein